MTDIVDTGHFKNKWSGWQIVQTVISGVFILIATNIWSAYGEATKTQQEMTKQLILLQATQAAQINDLTSIKAQLMTFNQVPQSLARIEVKLEEDERRINEIEQVRRAVK